MKRGLLFSLLALAAALSACAAVFTRCLSLSFAYALTLPFAPLGSALRSLSLSGSGGNLSATALYALLCLLPLIPFVFRLFRRRLRLEDCLLILLSALLFVVMYLMINPAYIPSLFPIEGASADIGRVILGGTVYSVLLGYIVLRLMRSFSASGEKKLLRWLDCSIAAVCVLLTFSIFGSGLYSLMGDFAALNAANSEASALGPTYAFFVFRYIVESLPVALEIYVAALALGLTAELRADRYGEGVVLASERLGRGCVRAVCSMMLSAIVLNLIQLVFSRYLYSVDYLTQLPLLSIATVLLVLLLSKFFAEGREIKADNDLFI